MKNIYFYAYVLCKRQEAQVTLAISAGVTWLHPVFDFVSPTSHLQRGMSSLSKAIARNYLDMVVFLLDRKADINICNMVRASYWSKHYTMAVNPNFLFLFFY